jgi:hypothetical protein
MAPLHVLVSRTKKSHSSFHSGSSGNYNDSGGSGIGIGAGVAAAIIAIIIIVFICVIIYEYRKGRPLCLKHLFPTAMLTVLSQPLDSLPRPEDLLSGARFS